MRFLLYSRHWPYSIKGLALCAPCFAVTWLCWSQVFSMFLAHMHWVHIGWKGYWMLQRQSEPYGWIEAGRSMIWKKKTKWKKIVNTDICKLCHTVPTMSYAGYRVTVIVSEWSVILTGHVLHTKPTFFPLCYAIHRNTASCCHQIKPLWPNSNQCTALLQFHT